MTHKLANWVDRTTSCSNAPRIVTENHPQAMSDISPIAKKRALDMLTGEQLPRICQELGKRATRIDLKQFHYQADNALSNIEHSNAGCGRQMMMAELVERSGQTSSQAGFSSSHCSTEHALIVRVESDLDELLLLPHAIGVAEGLNRSILLVKILHHSDHDRDGVPVDPVEWDYLKRKAMSRLKTLAENHAHGRCAVECKVLQSYLPPFTTVSGNALSEPILCVTRQHDELPWELDESTRRFMENGCPSVLLVPSLCKHKKDVRYQRIMVTLDGSSRAETVLPFATTLSRFYDAELYVVHATPDPGLTQTGPMDAEAIELLTQVRQRNERIAKQYLNTVRDKLSTHVQGVSTRLLGNGDVRHQLLESIKMENVDLVLIASHGTSDHTDVNTGAVARFMLEHSTSPVLMIGREQQFEKIDASAHVTSPVELRLPHPASSKTATE